MRGSTFGKRSRADVKHIIQREEAMKRICTLFLAVGMLLGAVTGANAIDFKARGQWLMGFGAADDKLIRKSRKGAVETKRGTNDAFTAVQRVRLQLDAVASEALAGTVIFEIGDQIWGQAGTGGALGADGSTVVEVQRAYIDWTMPDSSLKLRMGIQDVILPNAAGGTAVLLSEGAAALVASCQFNENLGLTALWTRPANDNYDGGSKRHANYLDSIDLFALTLPVSLDGFEITPWAMYGIQGKNALKGYKDGSPNAWFTADGNMNFTLRPYFGDKYNTNAPNGGINGTGKAYGSMFWAGLPFSVTAWDPLNVEVDLNYGYVEAMGRYYTFKGGRERKYGSTRSQGWLAKALVEYRLDWGVPGVFGWYASGDDGNVKNGSERMPSIQPANVFTSFLGAGNYDWMWVEYGLNYAGTWGLGLQIRDISFVEDLKHTIRAAWWGGTNSPSMVKYMGDAYFWEYGWSRDSYWGRGPYLTTNDGLLEINWINTYKMYENLKINLELGYVANFMDNGTWSKSGIRDSSFQKQDAWKAQLIFAYSF